MNKTKIKFIIILLLQSFFFQYFTVTAIAAGSSNFGINLNGADCWQETASLSALLKCYQVNNSFPEKDWWMQFNDPILAEYIEQAVRENKDANAAIARIEEAQALARAVMGQEFPQVSFYPIYARLNPSNFLGPNISNLPGTQDTILAGEPTNLFVLPVVINYELDYLFKNRTKTKAAKKDIEYMYNQYKTVLMTLTSSVATAYFNLLQADKLLCLNKELLGYLEKSLELRCSLFQEGEISYDDVLLNKQAISRTKSNIAEIEKLQKLTVHQLCILMGKPPVEQSVFPRCDFDKIAFSREIKTGKPADLIGRRPDILSAAAKLEKACLNIKVSFKELFPSINIYGILGYISTNLNRLFNSDSSLQSVAGGMSWSLFSGGTKTAMYKASKATAKAAVQMYQKAILTAFQEVEDSLSRLNSDFFQYCEVEKQTKDSEHLLALVNSRYKEGINSYIDVLDAQQKLNNQKQMLVQAKNNLLIDNISLYKALGGGF